MMSTFHWSMLFVPAFIYMVGCSVPPRPEYVTSEAYPVFWLVGGNNASAFGPGGVLDVEQFGMKPLNYSFCGRIGGSWPSLPNEFNNSGAINGGVPQAANLSLHLELTARNVEAMMPDPSFSGLGIYDFEAWVPIWEDNTASVNWHSSRYTRYSMELVKQQHQDWNATQIEALAKQEFETAAINFFVATLNLCSKLRPKALWGFYGMPGGSFAPTPTNRAKAIADAEKMKPVWEASGALFPSIYLDSDNATENRFAISATVGIAVEVAQMFAASGGKRIPVYPFAWECYHNSTTLLTNSDLTIDITEPYTYGADGVIIWGWTGFGPQGSGGKKIDTYIDHVRTVTGPITHTFEEKVKSCSVQYCSGHGRCVGSLSNFDNSNMNQHQTQNQNVPSVVESKTDKANHQIQPAVHVPPTCRCFDNFSGATCSIATNAESNMQK
eukprot:m.66052 g.66052  ORF g.66052 m.66052 type:complete len:440 (+) comp23635_c0_seq3:116-1435(+)